MKNKLKLSLHLDNLSHLSLLILIYTFILCSSISSVAPVSITPPAGLQAKYIIRQQRLTVPARPIGRCHTSLLAHNDHNGHNGSNSTTSTTSTTPPRILDRLYWLHIPKCGSSFATTLYHYACPLLPRDAMPVAKHPGQHGTGSGGFAWAFPWKDYCEMGPTKWIGQIFGHKALKHEIHVPITVTFVRDPRRRLYSAYHYNMHADGMIPEDRTLMLRTVKSLKDYAAFPGIAGCQTKMFAGFSCAYNITITPAIRAKALERLRKVAFVGDTDDWPNSICLFHSMFGGEINNHSFYNVRPSNHHSKGFDKDAALKELAPESDPDDWQFYLAAKAEIRRRQHKYGMPVYIPLSSSSHDGGVAANGTSGMGSGDNNGSGSGSGGPLHFDGKEMQQDSGADKEVAAVAEEDEDAQTHKFVSSSSSSSAPSTTTTSKS